jgi:excinuclease ABC subunit C
MDVKPPMVISLAKKEELVYIQARHEPVRLPRNNAGLRLLQYVRDEAHRFAQHYHHILRRKSQLEEDREQGRRPPARKRKKPTGDSTAVAETPPENLVIPPPDDAHK